MSDRDSIICLRPFYSLELHIRGDVFPCCPAWTRMNVGNCRDKSLMEIWNGRPLQQMRRLMLDGKWEKICRPDCPHILAYRLSGKMTPLDESASHVITAEVLSAVRAGRTVLDSGPTLLNLANSTVCNLNCIMCGREHHKDDPELVAKSMGEVRGMLPKLRELFLAGNGDPFARPDIRELLLEMDPEATPELRINLLTNGLLLPRYWERIKRLNFGFLNISIDAATAQTYQSIRRGGKWQDLLQTLELVRANRERFSYVLLNMTVMRENYREIPALVELAAGYGFLAAINRIRGKWGDQNIFTAGESGTVEELRSLIIEARGKAEALRVYFDSSSFDDLICGQAPTTLERYRQIAVDLARAAYYKLR